MARWLSIIGIGEDGIDGLSPQARRLIAEATLVVGGGRHLKLATDLIKGEGLVWRSRIEDTLPDIMARRPSSVCVLASGDPFHYGIGGMLAGAVPMDEIISLPQPSSFSLAASKLGWSLQETALVTIHGRPIETIRSHLGNDRRILALAWDGASAAALGQYLRRNGFGRSRLHVLEALGGPKERHLQFIAEDMDGRQTNPLAVLAIEVIADVGARQIYLAAGLPDDWFEHDGQMTRREMRALVLSALQPRPGQILWDIGGGSGSISIEWMLRHPTLSSFCIEQHAERCRRIVANAAAIGVPGLKVVEGRAPDCLAGLPEPDAIFVGGGTSDVALTNCLWDRLKPGGRFVANAVTIEGAETLQAMYRLHGGDLLRASFERMQPVGGFHAWKPAMPVVQWTATR